MRLVLKSILLIFFVCIAQTPSNAIVQFESERVTAKVVEKPPKKAKFWASLLKKRPDEKTVKSNKILLGILLAVAIGALIIHFQGSIVLSVIAFITFLGFQVHKWQRKHKDEEVVLVDEKGNVVGIGKRNPSDGKTSSNNGKAPVTFSRQGYSLVNKRSYANRSVRSFLWGIGLFALGLLLLIALIESAAAEALAILVFGALLVGLVFLYIAFGQSIKSLRLKEIDKDKAVIILVLSGIIVIPLTFSILFSGCGA